MRGCRLARQEALQLNQSIMAFPSMLDRLGPEISDPEEGKIETESPFLLHTLLPYRPSVPSPLTHDPHQKPSYYTPRISRPRT